MDSFTGVRQLLIFVFVSKAHDAEHKSHFKRLLCIHIFYIYVFIYSTDTITKPCCHQCANPGRVSISNCCRLCLKMDEEFPARIYNSRKTLSSFRNSSVQGELLDGIIQADSSAVSKLELAQGTSSIPNDVTQRKRLSET